MKNKTVLITGASSGIGKDLSFVYAKNNYNLILAARSIDKLNEIKSQLEKEFNISAITIEIDLSENLSAEKLHKLINEKSIEVDVLINNAGYGLNGSFIEIDLKSQIDMMQVNMTSLTKLSYLFANDMQKQKFGHIVNIASTASFQPIPSFAVYAATKAYVLHFSEAIAEELKPKNIFVTAICPGATKSNFMDNSGVKSVNFIGLATSMQVAEFTYKSVEKKRIVAVHGCVNKIMTFSVRFSPRVVIRKIAGKFFN